MLINAVETTRLVDPYVIHALFNIADTVCKYVFNNIIATYNEHDLYVKENMDLQSINFVSELLECINQFEIDNTKLTYFCKELIEYNKNKFIRLIPITDSNLKIELLTKLLPFGLDKDYMTKNAGIGKVAITNSNKKFEFI